MLERIQRYREHFATLVCAVIGVNIVVGVIRVALRAQEIGLRAAMLAADDFMGLVSVLLVCFVVGSCVLTKPPTRHARLLATLAAGLVTLGTVLYGVFFLIGMLSRQTALAGILEAIGGLTDLALKGGAAFALWQLVRRSPRPVTSGTLDQPQAVEAAPAAATTAPTTPRDAAAGARWNSAADAAHGAKAQWGSAQRGWGGGEAAVAPDDSRALPAPPQPEARAEVVQPVSSDALDGPAAKASADLWKRR